MSAQFANGLGNVRIADRDHVNPLLQGILYNTDRKAQVAVLKEESRRSSASSSASSTPLNSRKGSVVSPDSVSLASFSKDKRSKKSLFGMASFGKNRGVAGISNIM